MAHQSIQARKHDSIPARAARFLRGAACMALLGIAAPAPAADNAGTVGVKGDQRISYDDFVRRAAARAIESMDADKNGMVNRSEAAAAARRAAAQQSAPAPEPAPGVVKVSAPEPGPDPAKDKDKTQMKGKPPLKVTITVTGADVNGDGQVGVDELTKPLHESPAMRKAFNDLDKNKDGYLSKSELNGVDNNPSSHTVPLISVGF